MNVIQHKNVSDFKNKLFSFIIIFTFIYRNTGIVVNTNKMTTILKENQTKKDTNRQNTCSSFQPKL